MVLFPGRCDIDGFGGFLSITFFPPGPQPLLCVPDEPLKLQELFHIGERELGVSMAIPLTDYLGVDKQAVGIAVHIGQCPAILVFLEGAIFAYEIDFNACRLI